MPRAIEILGVALVFFVLITSPLSIELLTTEVGETVEVSNEEVYEVPGATSWTEETASSENISFSGTSIYISDGENTATWISETQESLEFADIGNITYTTDLNGKEGNLSVQVSDNESFDSFEEETFQLQTGTNTVDGSILPDRKFFRVKIDLSRESGSVQTQSANVEAFEINYTNYTVSDKGYIIYAYGFMTILIIASALIWMLVYLL